jgi:cytochrome oxidase Cu insertion factor (SCO1/SenC/PrrC family)
MWHRTAVASLAVCLAGGGALWHATDGLRALTSEQARRLSIAGSRGACRTSLEDQRGREFTLAQFRGAPVAVEFIYTRCQSLYAPQRRHAAVQRRTARLAARRPGG